MKPLTFTAIAAATMSERRRLRGWDFVRSPVTRLQIQSITSMLIKTARTRARQPFMLAVNEAGTGTVRHLRFPAHSDATQVREAVATAFGWPCCGDIHVVQEEQGGGRLLLRNDEDLFLSLAWHSNSEQKAEAWRREMAAAADGATRRLGEADNPQAKPPPPPTTQPWPSNREEPTLHTGATDANTLMK